MFPSPCILRPRWRGSRWNWVLALRVKKLEWRGYRADKEVLRYLQPSGQRDGRTDRQTDTGQQQRPRLCIASRGEYDVRIQLFLSIHTFSGLAAFLGACDCMVLAFRHIGLLSYRPFVNWPFVFGLMSVGL